MTRQFWRARLRLSGDSEVDKANRERMLDVLHESLVRAQRSNREALARGPIRIGEVRVGEPVRELGGDPVICGDCKQGLHGQCRDGTWCDCQHRSNSVSPPAVDIIEPAPVDIKPDPLLGQTIWGNP